MCTTTSTIKTNVFFDWFFRNPALMVRRKDLRHTIDDLAVWHSRFDGNLLAMWFHPSNHNDSGEGVHKYVLIIHLLVVLVV